MKKVCKITFFVSLALVILLVAVFAALIVSAESTNTSSVGIIGGADGPTAVYITSSLLSTFAFGNPLVWFFCLCGALLVASAIGWIVFKKS